MKNCPSCCSHCCASGALIVAGILFAIVALVHIYRIFYFFPIVIGTVVVGPTASIVAAIVFALLAIWMFWSASKASMHCDPRQRP